MTDTNQQILTEAFLCLLSSQNNKSTEQLDFLIHYLFYTDATHLKATDENIHALLLLLAKSEINDHLQGGFFNHANNFQKTLTSNARLINLFTNSSGHFFEGLFSVPAINSAQWIIKNLQSKDGTFFQGIGSENTLNNYYSLDLHAIKDILEADSFTAFISAYGLKNNAGPIKTLTRKRSYQQIADHSSLHIKQVPLALEDAHQQLALAKEKLVLPTIDKTISCKGNTKIISALFNAARQFNRDDFATAALGAIKCIDSRSEDTADRLLMIHALLMRLQYQWNDQDYQRLLKIAEAFSNHLKNITTEIVQAMIEHNIDSSVDDFYALYFLSSNDYFLQIAEATAEEMYAFLITNPENYPQLLIALIKQQSRQNFILIRGSKYESTYWLQQLATGFKPSNHIFAIANNCTGPDQSKFPIKDKTRALVFSSRSQQHDVNTKAYHSLGDLLTDCCS